VLLLKTEEGIGLDIALGGLPFEEGVIARATEYEFASGERIRTCSAEDLVVMKAIAGRDQDWLDIKGVIVRQSGKLEWRRLISDAAPLCELKGEPEIINRLEKLRDSVNKNPPGLGKRDT
jgi:hypothetical protein